MIKKKMKSGFKLSQKFKVKNTTLTETPFEDMVVKEMSACESKQLTLGSFRETFYKVTKFECYGLIADFVRNC